jgi:hypothetical protein
MKSVVAILVGATICAVSLFGLLMSQESCESGYVAGTALECTSYVRGSLILAVGAFVLVAGTAAAIRDLLRAQRSGTAVPLRTFLFLVPFVATSIGVWGTGGLYALFVQVAGRVLRLG